MRIERLFKQNCMTLRRSSSPGQADTSNVNQMKNMEAVLRMSEVVIVSEIDLKGISGSLPGNRSDIDGIIQRKAQLNDFNYLILPCADRFTRAGSLHAQKMLWDLAVCGIIVYFVQEQIFSDSELGRMQLGFLFDAARKQAFQTSKGTIEGQTYSFKDGKSPHSRLIPYGCDRLYSVGDKPIHVIRNLPDGTQEMWSPEPHHADRRLLQVFAKNPHRGTKNHYHKQRNESVTLIPGNPEHVKTVIHVMRRSWVDGIGCHVLAKELNTMGVPAARGNQWCTRSVYDLARRPIYFGLSVRGRQRRGIYHYANNDGAAIEANTSVQQLANCVNMPGVRRPRSEWIEVDCMKMATFLPAEIREVCRAGLDEYLGRLASAPARIDGKKATNSESPYLLTSILKSKQGNHKMIGSGGRTKWYVTSYSHSTPQPGRGTFFCRCIAVEPLHKAVLAILKDTLMTRPDLIKVIQNVLDRQHEEASSFDVPEARARLKSLRARQVAVSRLLTGQDAADDPITDELKSIDQQMADLRKQIDETVAASAEKPSAFVLHKQFMSQCKDFDQMDRPMIKALLKKIIQRMSVDLKTREVEMDLTLPHWCHFGAVDTRDGRPLGSAVLQMKTHSQNRKTPDFRPVLIRMKLQKHGKGTTEHYTWSEVAPEPLLKAA